MFGKRKKRRKSSFRARRTTTDRWTLSPDTKHAVLIVAVFALAFLSLLSLFQAAGAFGDFTNLWLGRIFGWGDWLFPLFLLVLGYFLLRPSKYDIKLVNYIGFAAIILSYSGLLHLPVRDEALREITDAGRGGGYIGYGAAHYLVQFAEFSGALLILMAVLLVGLFIFFNASFAGISAGLQQAFYHIRSALPFGKPGGDDEYGDEYDDNVEEEIVDEDEVEEEEEEVDEDTEEGEDSEEVSEPQTQAPKRRKPLKISIPLNLLTASNEKPTSGNIKEGMQKIESTLRSFNIEVTMGEVNVGPTVTQYTLKPSEGVKLNAITALQNDLSLALAAHPLRIEAPIPGKSLVGIEVPNRSISTVKLREILDSQVYKGRKNNLMLSLGKDVTGRVMMADLSKMPHMLIAGATGSGKSVCVNNVILSLLYQNSPDELKLILVDPKRVELSTYDDIPHLLSPVIIDLEKTVTALRWAVHQMDERYKLLAAAGKRNISSYNDSRLVEQMPYIVIIIDELADLMAIAAKEVEAAIIRLAQMARAVGIHLILSTQRPSVNVITGLIKANITTRIAFAVASATDSRTIIDTSGADKLLGNGDMLYMSAELSKPKRIQGSFVGDDEIAAVTNYIRERGEPEYDTSVTERSRATVQSSSGGFEMDAEERDINLATEVVIKAKRASATLLQSRMRIGFAKASRLLDVLEERGIIGPQNSSKPREVLITQGELDAQYGGAPADTQAAPEELEDEGEYEEEEEEEEEEIEEENEFEEEEEEEEEGERSR